MALLHTERLILDTFAPEIHPDASEWVVGYFRRNRRHLDQWDPARPPDFHTPDFWLRQLRTNVREEEAGVAFRFFLRLRRQAVNMPAVVGTMNFTTVVRGAFHSCNVGYGLDESLEGKGLMTEALRAGIDFMFQQQGLHRIQAGYIPENQRSGRLLERLGFEREGFCKDYLRIEGRWRDHILTAKRNPDWTPRA